ncbi:tetraacyldisaccharide 4'-kinase [Leptospira broomii serovar Hurstbridge str. 5399]|uniref:Tetraacyldisaccharide 4'-kinase n=1 Tax=Leptospira broomii serovar Hurstbridge str. 5399 TaxID=1049789 RepID=T0GI00_9LEPT|nr:tetraacyldisaccharide 4'-kinase [Leptospira broomii]EQA45023.1 tetraacyldisaccharide 4'-kinase [Leptospira broomii serovar Hurstbridge str. 5399]
MFLTVLRFICFPILYLLSFVYRLLFLLDRKRKKPQKLRNAIVISIGNFSTGGTGKTPFTLHLVKLLHLVYPKIPSVILSRGYGGSKSESQRVTLNSPSQEVGDEPLLLKQNLPFAEVYTGKNRISSYDLYRKELQLTDDQKVFVILDDGFQHHRIVRDLELVLLDCTKIRTDRFLLPAGLLREPYSSVNRADFLVASKYEDRLRNDLEEWYRKYLPKEILKFSFIPNGFSTIGNSNQEERKPNSILHNKAVLAFSGIGNPEPFFESLRKSGALVSPIRFPDHYPYSRKDIEELSRKAKGKDFLICTEKDAVKLTPFFETKKDPRWLYLNLDTKIENESLLMSKIDSLKKMNI